MPLKPGDKAPDFALLDQQGEPFTLSTSLEQRKARHLIYFYPKADTPGCTKQACGLRDVLPEVDAAVVGISPDPPRALARFDAKYGLGFPLLSDPDHAVADAYGTWGEKKQYGRTYEGIIRSAFLVDEGGRVAEAWYGISPADTPTRLTAALGA
jgi:peroxiredoxin Q/BCP